MYKKLDQLGDQQEGLNHNSDIIGNAARKTRNAIAGTALSGTLTTIGIQQNNPHFVGMGLMVGFVTTMRLILQHDEETAQTNGEPFRGD